MSKFYCCPICGAFVESINGKGNLVCCGKPMLPLTPNSTDAAFEKHVPVLQLLSGEAKVTIGEVIHPMTEAHYIEAIILETSKGQRIKTFLPGETPIASFTLASDEVVYEALAYCNLHGLWVKKA